jgi:type IV pilus assembly protein PilZ
MPHISPVPEPISTMPSGMLSCRLNSEAELQKAWMPFFHNGGLFVQTPNTYHMNDEVVVLLTLPDQSRHAATGNIGWINPSLGHRPAGVGVAFRDEAILKELKARIETLLVGQAPVPDGSVMTL